MCFVVAGGEELDNYVLGLNFQFLIKVPILFSIIHSCVPRQALTRAKSQVFQGDSWVLANPGIKENWSWEEGE